MKTKIKLNEKRKKQIREWLSEPDAHVCPFIYMDSNKEQRTNCKVCKRLFPMIHLSKNIWTNRIIVKTCPCHFLGIKKVIKSAEEWIL